MRKFKKARALSVNTLSRQTLEVFFQCCYPSFISYGDRVGTNKRHSLELLLFSAFTLFSKNSNRSY